MPTPTSLELDVDGHAADLCAFIDASPTPFHAVQEAARRLTDAGFTELAERDAWPREPGRYFVRREGTIAAWSTAAAAGASTGPATGFRVLGGHTDSPNLRIKPNADVRTLGWDQLGVEVYGGPLITTWLDRDLGLAGRVAVRDADEPTGVRMCLVQVSEPLLRVAHLAIHLDRSIADEGVRLNPQQHLAPIWGATGGAPTLAEYLAGLLDVEPNDVLAHDLMMFDLTPSGRLGHARDLIAAPRLDNQATCYAGVRALIDADTAMAGGGSHIPLLVLFDHEEIGSMTNRGGFSEFLPGLLERVVLTQGGDREDLHRALADSLVCSADMAHATHPNYTERHEPSHRIAVNAGPVLKVNVKGRYASDAPGAAAFALACEQAGVPLQRFVVRSDMPCGSTIGPMTAALTGVVTVDVGAPMLSMHSARELCGVADPAMYVAALTAMLAPAAV
ncbi:aspartyl aminopeptidase [Kineosphaera limosa]|uniref:M18 family aminopeptidase n=1 Tax=Kineosphaera limosa NBRC 100340 TaxID=1184609 RepID=K6VPY2_9MICO|nr:M18 family aminopeptidase [Kineosphaera limosa]NYE01596.1 aspartyl aminopeptidase [Kineosphaera limosa]GAB98268.1 putative peptidase M18 family protein [Kineosphaera limosa NBRC 100340]